MVDNRVTNGGGGVVGSVTISNTILARNAGGNCASVTLRDLGYTLSNDATCMLPGTGSMTLTPAGLASVCTIFDYYQLVGQPSHRRGQSRPGAKRAVSIHRPDIDGGHLLER